MLVPKKEKKSKAVILCEACEAFGRCKYVYVKNMLYLSSFMKIVFGNYRILILFEVHLSIYIKEKE